MNRYIRNLLFVAASLIWLVATGAGANRTTSGLSPADYDPENPPEPKPSQKLTIVTNPSELSMPREMSCMVGESVYLSAFSYSNYDFVSWSRDGEVISTESGFYFDMPETPVTLTVNYVYNPSSYDPENPPDPDPSGPAHRVTVYANPSNVHNPLVYRFEEDKEVTLTADDYSGYRPVSWVRDGRVVSTESEYSFVMPHTPFSLTVNYEYNPDGPEDPGESSPYRETVVCGRPEEARGGEKSYAHIELKSANVELSALRYTVKFDPRVEIDCDEATTQNDRWLMTVVPDNGKYNVEVTRMENGYIPNGEVFSFPFVMPGVKVGEVLPIIIDNAYQVTTDGTVYPAKTENGSIVCTGNVLAESLSIEGSEDRTVTVGSTLQFGVSVYPEGASTDVAWSSSDTDVATIDANGVLRALAVGRTTVTATTTDGTDLSASCNVTVEHSPITGIDINLYNTSLPYGESTVLTATVNPSSADQKVEWSILEGQQYVDITQLDDLSVRVTGNGIGVARLGATAGGMTAQATVSVFGRFEFDDTERHVTVNRRLQVTVNSVPANVGKVDWKSLDIDIIQFGEGAAYTSTEENMVTIHGVNIGRGRLVAYREDGLMEADTCWVEVLPRSNRTEAPVGSYDGRWLRLECEDEGSELFFSFDNATFETAAEPVELNKDILTIYAYAKAPDLIESDTVAVNIPCFYDGGGEVWLHRANSLAKALEWCDGVAPSSVLSVTGVMGADDFATLRAGVGVEGLDLTGVTAADEPSLKGAPSLKWTKLGPVTVGNAMFEGCPDMAAVVWDSSDTVMEAGMLDGLDNPNLLVYVASESQAPAGTANLIVGSEGDYRAGNIELKDDGHSPYFAPFGYFAEEISYVRFFAQETGFDGETRGYESIMLPFDVEKFTHKYNGSCLPFAAIDNGDVLPFWLYSVGTPVSEADRLEAYKPYLISMPNNDRHYYDDEQLGGIVRFSASSTNVDATPQLTDGSMGRIAKRDGLYVINVSEPYEENPEGSVWVNGLRDVRPFESYIAMESPNNVIGIFDPSSIEEILISDGRDLQVRTDGDCICVVASRDAECGVYDVSGALVRKVRLTASCVERVGPLAHGIYIVRVGRASVKVRL